MAVLVETAGSGEKTVNVGCTTLCIPYHDTIRRVLYLDEKAFNQAFIGWISYTLSSQYRQASVDGKTLWGSYESELPALSLVVPSGRPVLIKQLLPLRVELQG